MKPLDKLALLCYKRATELVKKVVIVKEGELLTNLSHGAFSLNLYSFQLRSFASRDRKEVRSIQQEIS